MKNKWRSIFNNVVVVDVETTGFNANSDRIIEVGAVVVKGNRVVDKYQQLINPDVELDQRITQVTGINPSDLINQPKFHEVASNLLAMLNRGGVFIAHNAQFDYDFLWHEFNRVDINFAPPRLCTLDLSRAMFPGEQVHSLSTIVKRMNIKLTNHHRALDDALATWHFFQKVNDLFSSYALELAYERIFQAAPAKRINQISAAQMSLLP